MINFCKNSACPSSEDLLAFQKGEILPKESKTIRHHLDSCEFCAAEAIFYARFPLSEEVYAETKIPAPLLELAEALLGNKQKKSFLLNRLLNETEGVKI